jgi:hypothetical protein
MAIKPMVRAAVIGAAAAACAALVVPAANASGTPQVVVNCESGSGRFLCAGSVSGGTAPYTITWTAVTHATITRTGGATAQGTCSPGTVDVRMNVRDAAGATASADDPQGCNFGPPL